MMRKVLLVVAIMIIAGLSFGCLRLEGLLGGTPPEDNQTSDNGFFASCSFRGN